MKLEDLKNEYISLASGLRNNRLSLRARLSAAEAIEHLLKVVDTLRTEAIFWKMEVDAFHMVGNPWVNIVPHYDYVEVCGVRIERPSSVSPRQWLMFWEGKQ
jgi:hypothetical protein